MAITLQITDGTDTVDFNDGSNLHLGAAFQMNVGEGAVTEQIIAGWANSLDADAKAVISKKFNRLIRKAILHYREQRIDRAVWLVWKPDDQTDTQYAKVMGGGEVEVVKHTIGGWGGGYFNPTIIREGAWRSVAPDGTAGAALSTQTANNRVTASPARENWADIPSSRTNDAPALLSINLTPGGTGYTNVLIGMKRGTESDLDNFNPHFNPDDQTSAIAETTPSTNAPNDVEINISASSSVTWDIADTDLPYYVGSYNVYAVTYQDSGAGSYRARFIVGSQTGQWKDVGTTAATNLLYLGSFNIPGVPVNPFLDFNTSSDLEIELEYEETGTATCVLYGLFLVPTDIPPFELEFASGTNANDEILIDGVNELTLHLDINGDVYTTEVTNKGRFPVSYGGTTNRLFFYSSGTSGYIHTMSLGVDITVVDRFLGLRGNT